MTKATIRTVAGEHHTINFDDLVPGDRRQELEWWDATGLIDDEAPAAYGIARSNWVARHRTELVNRATTAGQQLLADAAEVAATLAEFLPTLDAAQIVATGTGEQLDALRNTRDANKTFGAILMAFRATWKAACGGVKDIGPRGENWTSCEYRPGAPGGIHVWERPDDVEQIVMLGRSGPQRDILNHARWATVGGWRLATPDTIRAVTAEHRVEQPHARFGEALHPVWVAVRRQPRSYVGSGDVAYAESGLSRVSGA